MLWSAMLHQIENSDHGKPSQQRTLKLIFKFQKNRICESKNIYLTLRTIMEVDICLQNFSSHCKICELETIFFLNTTPFCRRFWPMGKTVLNSLHIEGTTSCHFLIKIRYLAKIFDVSLSQLVIEQNFQHSAKQIDIGQNDSSVIKTVRHSAITDWWFDKTPHVYFRQSENTHRQSSKQIAGPCVVTTVRRCSYMFRTHPGVVHFSHSIS